MKGDIYSVDRLVAELKKARDGAQDEPDLLLRVVLVARRAAMRKDDWLRPEMARPDAAQGFGFHLLHEEGDHALAVFVASWLAHRGTPPHDHGTWAVVVGLDGSERNAMWKRLDDGTRPGYAELEKTGERTLGAGEFLAMRRGVIHSVWNDSERVSVSLHIYGRHVNHTTRSQFDPERRLAAPYKVATHGSTNQAAETADER